MDLEKQERRVKEMKRVTKIVTLASILSFILYYSSFISYLQQRLQLLSMYSNLVDKKYMFLLCNGIMGFIVTSFRGNSDTLLHDKAINIVEHTKEVKIKDRKEAEVTKVVTLLEEKSVSKEEEDHDEGRLVQDLAIVAVDDHYDDRLLSSEDVDDHYDDRLLSSEDLNKKCEDFIRKMKAQIRKRSI